MLLVGVVNLHAETKDSVDTSKLVDPYYYQFYGGINKSANENLPWTEFTKYPWSGGLFVGLGKELSPLWGWRAALRFNHNKSRNVQDCESPETWGWNNLALFGDATFDVTDGVRKIFGMTTPTRGEYFKWNVKAFAGVGAAFTFAFDDVPLSYTHPYNRNSQLVAGTRAGVTATYRVADQWRVGMELSQNLFQDQFNGVKAEMPLDGRTNLKVGVTYLVGKKKTVLPPPIMDPRLKVVPDLPFRIPDVEEVKVRHLEGRAFIDFIVDRTELRPDYRRNNAELKRMRAKIDSVLFDPTVKVSSISLHGYASPESPYSHNVELSLGRVNTIKNYIQQHYRVEDSKFILNHTPEDWGNLKAFIENDGVQKRTKSDIWYESTSIVETPKLPDYVLNCKSQLLAVIDRVINQNMDPDEQELELKKVGGGEPYKWLLKHVYPGLRHTDYIIEYVVQQYQVKDGKRLIYTHPEALSVNEMYQVAKSYPTGSDGWLEALLIAAKTYPEDETARLNAACASVQVKRLKDARNYLAGINSPEANYVRDVIAAMEGTIEWKLVDNKVVKVKEAP